MSDKAYDPEPWLRRIGYEGPREPGLAVLRALITAHSGAIPFENADVLLGRAPLLDLPSLHRKLIEARRGGYCFETNGLFHAGLSALGFSVTGLMARVIVGMAVDAPGPPAHRLLRVDLAEGAFLADVGFGNQTPTAPLLLRPGIEQPTPHETMRLQAVGEELTLQAKIGEEWRNIYRLSLRPTPLIDYEVSNWFTATHPRSPFVSNLVAARPGPDGTRHTFFNGRLSVRRPDQPTERFMLDDQATIAAALRDSFGLSLSGADLTEALAVLDRKGTRGVTHPSFA